MVWSGQVSTSAAIGGRNGFPVLIGDRLMVPRLTTWKVDGANGHPDARVRVEVRDGRPEVVEFWIGAKPKGRGIASADVASIGNLDNLVANILTEVGSHLHPTDEAPGHFSATHPPSEKDAWAISGAVHSAREARRNRVSTEELETVARLYREHADKAPLVRIAAELGVSHRTAARRVEQARAAGILPPTTPGKVTH